MLPRRVEKTSLTPDSPITELFPRLSPAQKDALKKLGIETVLDLLYHFPARYGNVAEIKDVKSLKANDFVSVYGKVTGLKSMKTFKTRTTMTEGFIEDLNGNKIKCVWFHQPYIAKILKDESLVKMSGTISERKGEIYFSNPEFELLQKIPLAVGGNLFGENDNSFGFPVYPESKGITSKWFFHAIERVLKSGVLDRLLDPIPNDILKKYHLPNLKHALIWLHTPKTEKDANAARKRFAFEEIFLIQIVRQRERLLHQQKKSFILTTPENVVQDFIDRFPFEPTESQLNAMTECFEDMKSGKPMSRLLEGDVGSGKTAVAAALVFAAISSSPNDNKYAHLQTAYMAPTEILAKQHFESFINFFKYTGVQVGLITSSGCYKFPSKVKTEQYTKISKNQLLKWLISGDIPILIGTHSLIAKGVQFKNLAFVIIDEQHRFGTKQRQMLARKDEFAPHLLSMTATPIPRTLALTLYGDLDLTLLDQMPSGRKAVITKTVSARERQNVYETIREELKNGRQAYIICPRIDEPDPDKEKSVQARSVSEESKNLKKIFPEFKIGVLHGKMSAVEKDEAMMDFLANKFQILVATSVVEVGVNNPNASVIIIEGGERFGLAQLHQLRGRVIRGNHQPYCFIFAETSSQKTTERLKAIVNAKNGFELAEHDLQQRGAGDLLGRKQWGVSDVAMEALKNLKLVEAARTEAQKIVEKDNELILEKHISIAKKLKERKDIHLE